MVLKSSEILIEITKEASKMNPLEQQLLLTKLRVKRLKKKRVERIANVPNGLRKPTLKQIDKWKHSSKRKK
jgi:hypothetical protein